MFSVLQGKEFVRVYRGSASTRQLGPYQLPAVPGPRFPIVQTGDCRGSTIATTMPSLRAVTPDPAFGGIHGGRKMPPSALPVFWATAGCARAPWGPDPAECLERSRSRRAACGRFERSAAHAEWMWIGVLVMPAIRRTRARAAIHDANVRHAQCHSCRGGSAGANGEPP